MQITNITRFSILFTAVLGSAAPKPYKLGSGAFNKALGLSRRYEQGYQPTQDTCGSGSTCSEACGKGYITCDSSVDEGSHCFNPDAGEKCCPNNSGDSCAQGYYCTEDSKHTTWCCPDGTDLASCAAAYYLTDTLVSQTVAPTTVSSASAPYSTDVDEYSTTASETCTESELYPTTMASASEAYPTDVEVYATTTSSDSEAYPTDVEVYATATSTDSEAYPTDVEVYATMTSSDYDAYPTDAEIYPSSTTTSIYGEEDVTAAAAMYTTTSYVTVCAASGTLAVKTTSSYMVEYTGAANAKAAGYGGAPALLMAAGVALLL
ncbi:hypothetical protein BP6252_07952 [Coleophoma cylindrospora]|uniref:Uncharacterized protein n=1 Tax=Coleophoma cylindrospora TaxID=1849047 RepID=A0A3D8RBF4_9HELO|nr:hypothetical protein BP6252_07952 [Coleophoma cylindrospora]